MSWLTVLFWASLVVATFALWEGHCAHADDRRLYRNVAAVNVTTATLLLAFIVPRSWLVAALVTAGAGMVLTLVAAAVVWPILEDVFVEPRRRRNWRREIARDNHSTARGHRH